MQPKYTALSVGDEVFKLVKPPITKVQLVRYAGASGDFNPLHTDDQFAQNAGFGGVVAHGMLVMAFVAEAASAWCTSKWLSGIKVRFKGITRPGDEITVIGRVLEKRIEMGRGVVICSVEATDQHGEIKAAGTFLTKLPLESWSSK